MGSWRGGEPAGEAKRSWRKKGNAASTNTGGKYWATGRGSKLFLSGNILRLFVALVVLLATSVGMVVSLLKTDSPTPLISLITVDYQHPWAPNAWAVEDQQRLESLKENSQFKVTAKQQSVGEGTWFELIDLELEKIKHGGPGGSLIPAFWGYHTVIIHLSTHGVLNAVGQPCLLFADADPLNDQTWVPLADVLRRIGENKTVKNGKDVRVLVVLDTGKQPPDIRCGLLCSGFAEAASQTIQSLPFANFAVLLSCDEDQCAWTAPEMGGSVFGVMVTSGLQGHADRLAENSNGRVTVQKLFEFVSSTVDGYVREYRGRVQNPKLVWCGENQENDFELCLRAKHSPSVASTYQSNDRLAAVNDAWQKFEEWSKRTPSYAAWQRATVSNRLARAEQLLWAGTGYQTQFSFELNAASKITNSRIVSGWPTAICGGSLAFLDRVRGINTDLVLETEGLDWRSLPALKPNDSSAETRPALSPTTPPTTTEAGSTHAATASTPAAETAPPSTASTADSPAKESIRLAGQIVAWLTFDAQAVAGAPPPERPGLPDRALAVSFLIRWLAQNPQQVNWRVMSHVLDWLGPIVDGPSVSREEALLRTINDHLQLTSSWNLSTINDLARLWSQYLQTTIDSEFALALIDPRATTAFEREAAALLRDLQLARDHIHGCETQRDASDCANEIKALQSEIKRVLDIRDRLEKGWKLRDELALELSTLAQWITSPIGRSQSQLSSAGAWQLVGQLNQRLRVLQTELADRKIPELVELATIEGELEQLVAAYSQSMHDLMEIEITGQRRSLLGDLMLSLGLRPNVFRGLPLGDRAELHRGLNARYSDLVGVFEGKKLDEKLQQYYDKSQHIQGIDEEPIWRIADLPKDISTNYSPLLFTEAATARPLESIQATGISERGKWNALGGELRRRWSELPNELVKSCLASVQSMSSQDEAAIREAEEQLMSSEHHAHLIAQLLPSDSLNVAPLPTILTHEVYDELFAMWQARRALNDFWKTPAMPQASMFMSASALDWLGAVPRPATGPAKLLEQSQEAEHERAVGWKDVIRQVTSIQDAEDARQAELSVKNFPAGTAWLRLELGGNSSAVQPLQNRRFQTRQETGSQGEDPTRVTLLTGQLPEGNHELVAWFRGHTSSKSIPVYNKQPPVILAWQAEEVGTTTIRVDAEPKPARIVFVLDCSGSMKEDPMKLAKDTLLNLIRGLSRLNAGQTEIAVVLFGHTAEYLNSESDSHSKWPGPHNRPFNDVEVIQDLALPSEQVITRLQHMLAHVVHHGRTPLYEAIIQSIDLLSNRNDGFAGDERVVIITDGGDNILPLNTGLAGNARVKDKVNDKLFVPNKYIHSPESPIDRAADRVNLDFVSFNFDPKGNLAILERIASATGGKVYKAGNQNLTEQLKNSIARNTFSTTDLKTKRTVGSRVRLNDEQVIPGNQLPGEFEVQIDDIATRNTVALLGGESIVMRYSNQGGLTYAPKEGDRHPQIGTFSYNGHPYQALMLTGVPDSIPQVRICLQSQVPKYQSLRPDVWLLELQSTKLGQAGEGERLAWTADALWENYHNSPVLRVNLKNLPDLGRDRLECRLWLRNRSNPQPTQRLPIAGLKKTAIAPGVEVSAETEIESGGLRLTVTEQRKPDAPLVHWQVFPAPDRFVEHHVSSSQVSHQYFYSDRTVLRKLELAPTPLPAAANKEWESTQWIPVPKWKK